MMDMNHEEELYRVILKGIGKNTEEEKELFCREVSENYGFSQSLLRKILDRSPIVLKKNLPKKKAELLAKTFKSFGAIASVEKKIGLQAIQLEIQGKPPYQAALESCSLRKTERGTWNVVGRIRNISQENLTDIWVLIQLFDDLDELITFEETTLPINPLPPGETSPFKIILDGGLPLKWASIIFRNAMGISLSTVDRRKKKEWIEVEMGEDWKKVKPLPISETRVKLSSILKVETPPVQEEINLESEKEREEERILMEEKLARLESIEEKEERAEVLTSILEEKEEEEGKEGNRLMENQTSQIVIPLEIEDKIQEETFPLELQHPQEEPVEMIQSIEEPAFQELPSPKEEPSVILEERRADELPPYPWIEEFKKAIEIYYRDQREGFQTWFESVQKENESQSPFRRLLTLLAYARFNQERESERALKNTQKVFKLLHQSDLKLGEIPEIDGTSFFSGEIWKDLFFRAVPKLQEVAYYILEKKDWKALELERFIQVIPHMGIHNSRWAVRSIPRWIPEMISINFSDIPIAVEEGLYRVASRLGVVNPMFDYYQGRHSMGDFKIQSFGKAAFPEDPARIEEPMSHLGKGEKEGHCFPIQPRCEGCLFEAFCPKLYPDINPSEKGMIE